MTRWCFQLLAACAVLAGCGGSGTAPDAAGPPPSCEHQVRPALEARLFAVGHHLSLEEAESAEAYRAAIRATVEADVVPHLAGDRPNILVFPESIGLSAVFLGERGAMARAQTTTLDAFAALAVTNVDGTNFYAGIVPGAGIATLILLAMTDPMWAAFDETFSDIARDHGVWVVTSTDVGDVERTGDPEAVEALAAPERAGADEVFWVPEGRVYNQALFYGPDGQRYGQIRKHYLTDGEIELLELSGGLPEKLGPVETAGLRAAAMISRDAWMQDALERASLRGADVLLQNEAFIGGWTIAPDGYTWPPDNLKRSGWAAVQKYPELRYAVAPMLVGNLFEIVFDGQSFAVAKATPDDEPAALVGQEPDVGWRAIAPWVVDDDPGSGSLEERRAMLEAEGEARAPGGELAGEYLAGTVWIDVTIPAGDGYPVVADAAPGEEAPALGESRPVAPSGLGRQRSAAALVLADGALLVAWEDTRFCTGQILVARSDDGGLSFSEPVRVQPWDRAQHSPALVEVDGAVVVAWHETMGDSEGEIRVARSTDGGATWSDRIRVDWEQTIDAWKPALAADPATGRLYLAFVDSRERDDGAAPSRRIYVTTSDDGGLTWAPAARLDPRARPAGAGDTTYTNEWAPAIAAAGGRVVVAYTHRHRPDDDEQPSNDVFVIESTDGGASWGEPRRIDEGGFPERLSADLALDLDDAGWLLAYSSLRGTGYDADVAVATAPGALSLVPDAAPPRDQWLPAIGRLSTGDRVLAWQDLRNGSADIFLARFDGAAIGPPLRVDDAGPSAAHSWRPTIAVAPDDTVHIIWEDSRSGHAELRIASASLP